MDVDETDQVNRIIGPPVHRIELSGQRDPGSLDARAESLLADYDEWLADRCELADRESDGGPSPRASEWQANDDTAETLLQSFADLLREATR